MAVSTGGSDRGAVLLDLPEGGVGGVDFLLDLRVGVGGSLSVGLRGVEGEPGEVLVVRVGALAQQDFVGAILVCMGGIVLVVG